MNIALCFSGHLRNFDKCIDNIKQNIITPLKESNNIDIFLSTWNVKNCRTEKEPINLQLIEEKISPAVIDVEEPKQFTTNSTNFLKYPGYCSPDTCSNAISMWYRAYRVKKILEQYITDKKVYYDIVFRVRPDMFFYNKIDLTLVNEAITNDCIYMPIWHGKYEIVTKQLMDQFAFGNFKIMKTYFNVYENINELLNRPESVHTGEGLLFEQIKECNLKRFELHYGLVRDSGIDNIV